MCHRRREQEWERREAGDLDRPRINNKIISARRSYVKMNCVDPVVFFRRDAWMVCGRMPRLGCALGFINGDVMKCVGKKMFEQAAHASECNIEAIYLSARSVRVRC